MQLEGNKLRSKIGAFMKQKREKAGLTQSSLALKMNYTTPQFISNWERGKCEIPVDSLKVACKACRIGASEYLDLYSTELRAELMLLLSEG